jgi:hypothetical protein
MITSASNITTQERFKRLMIGAGILLAAGGAAAALILAGVDRRWRIALWLPLWAGLYLITQARTGT